nr:BCCT family transporter [Marinicella sp. W31]MDC2878899.1 BCCT family transporter [Marinicella sp. W31]
MQFNKVVIISLLLCLPIGAWGVVAPDQMAASVLGFTSYFMVGASWWWLALCSSFVILAAFLAFGPYGSIRLGKDDEKPEFSYASWIAMLFAGGMGAGLLFWGVAEPVTHFENPPVGVGGSAEAARQALVITNLHWGLHAWSIYGVCALVIAYFTFRLDKPPLISTPLRGLFHGRTSEIAATTADVLGVVAVVFGLAGSLAMGALQVRSGLTALFDVPAITAVSLAVLVGLFVMYMISTLTGVEKGMKLLSDINMGLGLALMAFILIFGPTAFIMETFVTTLGSYISQFVNMSFRLFPFEGLTEWSANWTLTYLIWWLAWGPFVGVFIARISRGRTIREFCMGVILIPTVFSVFWFAVFGGAGIYVEMYGPGGLASVITQDVAAALFTFLDYFPFPWVLSIGALLLIVIFLVTSADSGTFVLSMMTTNGNLNPPATAKIVWGSIVAVITGATLLAGSVDVARAMSTLGAIPFSAILILQIVSFLRRLRHDPSRQSTPTLENKTGEVPS